MAEGKSEPGALIAALGNPLMGDDGAGLAILNELRRRGAERRARLCDLGAAGVDLLIALGDESALILLDAIAGTEPPGTVRIFRGAELLRYAEERGGGSHQPSLAETLRLGERLGMRLRMVALVGIVAGQFELGQGLSPEVAAAVPAAAGAAEQLLSEAAASGC